MDSEARRETTTASPATRPTPSPTQDSLGSHGSSDAGAEGED